MKMRLLLEIKDEDLGLLSGPVDSWRERRTARCVLRRGDMIALLHVRKHHYHKLAGGGVEAGESAEDALRREVEEEVGSLIEIGERLGEIVEYRSRFSERQTSTCYLATETHAGQPRYTDEELANDFKVEWYSTSDALSLLGHETPHDYEGKFIVRREFRFLQEASTRVSVPHKKPAGN